MCAVCMNHTGVKLVALVSILNPLLQLCIPWLCVCVSARVCESCTAHDDFICINYEIQLWFCYSCGFLSDGRNRLPCRTVVQLQIKLRSKCVESSSESIIHAIHTSAMRRHILMQSIRKECQNCGFYT